MVTAEAVAVNPALVAPAGISTDAGTVTEVLLLTSAMLMPPVPAAAVRETVQLSLPAPVIELLLHVSAFRAADAAPVPFNAIAALPADVFVVNVTAPVTAPAAVGSNCTTSEAVWPWLSVTGKLGLDIVNPLPVADAPLIVRGAVPDDVIRTDCVVGVFSVTFPKDRLVAARVSPGAAPPRPIAKV